MDYEKQGDTDKERTKSASLMDGTQNYHPDSLSIRETIQGCWFSIEQPRDET
jgi:hypothetical protein